MATKLAPISLNFSTYNGSHGIYAHSFEYKRKADCPICGTQRRTLSINRTSTVRELIHFLVKEPSFQLRNPSLRTFNKTIYMTHPISLEIATRKHLDVSLYDLLPKGQLITITDPALPYSFEVDIVFNEGLSLDFPIAIHENNHM